MGQKVNPLAKQTKNISASLSKSEHLAFSVKYEAISLHCIKPERTQIWGLRMDRKVMSVQPLTDKEKVEHFELSIAPNT